MRYAIKHAYGISEDEYQGTIFEPLFGMGQQGTGSSPAIWLGLVVILLNTFVRMAAEYHITGFEFNDPWDEIAATWNVGAFVDDTNQGVTDSKGTQSNAGLVETLYQGGQIWENLLHFSCGVLNLSKFVWSFQFWEWHKGRPRLQKMSEDDPHLAMTSDSSPEHILICQVDNDSAPKELGVYKEDTNLYKNCILCTEFKSPPNLVRDKEIYYTWTGSILTCAGLACDLTVQLMEHEGEDQ